MNETMSSPNDRWGQFYHHHQQSILSNQVPPSRNMFANDRVSDSTVVTSTVTTTSTPVLLANSSSGGSGHLSPEGRVSKPVRRRSRASRRTPTTLLNTDTTNFRAMVQQFTGGPSAPYASGSQLNGQSFSFGLGLRQGNNANPSPAMVPAAVAGYHLQYPQQQQQYQNQSHPQSYMISLGNTNTTNDNDNNIDSYGHDFFLQKHGNIPRSTSASMELAVSDGFLMEGISSQVLPANPAHHHHHYHPSPAPPSFLQ
ncbi:hypothetical protein K2173_018032 [Erythroxylum novogranatense]|uniref:VQ domain-containing protein n=1 Tax=Erythroxylum novogranatense TaxID=1862640 RepID=A0AAV8TUB9_9ROSI|nr:hypothetical protein K2173_018032 [Erythroxylum novogranatense]